MVDKKTLRAAVASLGIDVPVLTADKQKDGFVRLTTRNGVHIWHPDELKTKPLAKPKSRSRKKGT